MFCWSHLLSNVNNLPHILYQNIMGMPAYCLEKGYIRVNVFLCGEKYRLADVPAFDIDKCRFCIEKKPLKYGKKHI